MKERLKFAGGEFRVQSRPGSGTQVEASIPIPAPFSRTA
jgi:signal transduction histidine kinase